VLYPVEGLPDTSLNPQPLRRQKDEPGPLDMLCGRLGSSTTAAKRSWSAELVTGLMVLCRADRIAQTSPAVILRLA